MAHWAKFKKLKALTNEQVVKVMNELGLPEAKKLSDCGQFVNSINCHQCDSKHFAGFTRCKNRYCLTCAWVKGLSWIARTMQKVEELAPHHNFSLLTLTLRNQKSLSLMIQDLEQSWRYMVNGNKANRQKWKERFVGGIRSLEIKKGENSRLWHAHFHVILAYSKYQYKKDYEDIKEMWDSATGNKGSVHIKQISSKGKGIIGGVLETFKYAIKPGKEIYEVENFLEIWETTKGKRQINTFGVFRGLGKKVDEDIENLEQKKLEQFVCSQCGFTKGYLKSYFYDTVKDEVLY